MVSSEKKLANAMGGKTARACDRCIQKRARWYCATDDVFLCHFCDSFVHSSNSNPNLARAHERVRLKLSSLEINQAPSWHQGFTKKSRTPRGKNNNKDRSHGIQNRLHLVPEIGSDDHLNNAVNSDDSFCFSGEFSDMVVPIQGDTKDEESEFDLNGLILPSDLELAEFAADVESLLGKSTLDEESFNMECGLNDLERVKVEEEVPLELSFDYDYLSIAWEEEEEDDGEKVVKKEDEKCVVDDDITIINDDDRFNSKKNKKMLKLDYEGIMAAWDDERSPWATGDRPDLDPNDYNWLHCMGGCGKMQHCECGDMGMNTTMTRLDGGREARVSRYREKRRTRLFSKKIRYEVRKLNAEKRPRIKGRFVKRPTTPNSVVFPLLTT